MPSKVLLLGINPMVWRRVLVPSNTTLRELHGVIQVATGWDGIHLYKFRLRSARYREHAQGRPFSRRTVNARLRKGEHREFMHQQC